MKSKVYISIMSVMFLTVACQKPADKPSQEVIESKYFVNGDPMELVKDARLNNKTFLTLDNYKTFTNMEVSGKTAFFEKTLRQEQNQDDMDSVKKSNQTPTEEKRGGSDLSSDFKISDDGKTVFLEIGKDSKLSLSFHVNADKSLELKGMGTDSIQYSVTPIHYSVNPENTAFSFLFSMKHENENMLWGFSFYKKSEKSVVSSVVEAAKKFYYLFGKGLLIGQQSNKPLVLSACGKNSELFRDEIMAGVAPWKATLQGRLDIQLEFTPQCAPIFDVNTKSLQFLENRITRASKKVFNPAATFPRASFSNSLIVGGDILIFKGEFKRMTEKKDAQGQPEGLRTQLKTYVMHEFGHLLGLGHPFESSEPSIMGYDEKIKDITAFDIEAVTTLYPLKDVKPKD